MSNNVDISIIIPIFNESENLPELFNRLSRVLVQEMRVSHEIIFVDDGSSDGSWDIIEKLHAQTGTVKGIRFSRNFGHHIAITAGVDLAQGQAVVLMDGDLQDPPEEIPKLYAKILEGYDNAYAIRETRKDPWLKKLTSKYFYLFFKWLANVDIHLNSGIFRIMNRPAANALKNCPERFRFITALMSWTGFTHIGVNTRRDERYAGKPKYNFIKSLKLAIDGITSFSYIPLRIATHIGLWVSLISFIIGLYLMFKKIFLGMPVLGYASIIVSVFFIGGIQLMIIGVMGSYVGRIYAESQRRPLYIIKKSLC